MALAVYSEAKCFSFLNQIYFYIRRLAKALSRGKHEGRIYYRATRHVWGWKNGSERIICDPIVRSQDSQTSRVMSQEFSEEFLYCIVSCFLVSCLAK